MRKKNHKFEAKWISQDEFKLLYNYSLGATTRFRIEKNPTIGTTIALYF